MLSDNALGIQARAWIGSIVVAMTETVIEFFYM